MSELSVDYINRLLNSPSTGTEDCYTIYELCNDWLRQHEELKKKEKILSMERAKIRDYGKTVFENDRLHEALEVAKKTLRVFTDDYDPNKFPPYTPADALKEIERLENSDS